MTDDVEATVRAMVWKVIRERTELDVARDANILDVLMRTAVACGLGFDDLTAFRGDRRVSNYGFFRDSQHYAGVCRINSGGFRLRTAIMVRSTGSFWGPLGLCD